MASVCPECGSTKYRKQGFTVVDRKRVQRYLCQKCYRSFTYPHYTGKKKSQEQATDTEGEK